MSKKIFISSSLKHLIQRIGYRKLAEKEELSFLNSEVCHMMIKSLNHDKSLKVRVNDQIIQK